jgi:hypothetical protein
MGLMRTLSRGGEGRQGNGWQGTAGGARERQGNEVHIAVASVHLMDYVLK